MFHFIFFTDETATTQRPPAQHQNEADNKNAPTTTTPTGIATTPTRRKMPLHKCLQNNVYYGVALKGGWTSGKFTDKGLVPSLRKCVELCCNDTECDLAMLLSQKCFTIHCYNLEDCQTVPNGHAQIAYVSREGFLLRKRRRHHYSFCG